MCSELVCWPHNLTLIQCVCLRKVFVPDQCLSCCVNLISDGCRLFCVWRAVQWLSRWNHANGLKLSSCFLTALLCGRAAGIQGSPVCPTACTLRSVWKQEEEEQYQTVCAKSFHHGQLWGTDPWIPEWVYIILEKVFPKKLQLLSYSVVSFCM